MPHYGPLREKKRAYAGITRPLQPDEQKAPQHNRLAMYLVDACTPDVSSGVRKVVVARNRQETGA
jgi:hypothetical protein